MTTEEARQRRDGDRAAGLTEPCLQLDQGDVAGAVQDREDALGVGFGDVGPAVAALALGAA